jgi:outer membrane lipoprotein SlyB
VVATVAGAVIGGLAGAAGEEGITRKDAQQITVKLDDGRLFAIVQAGKTPFKGGERVQVLTSPDGNMRVEPATSQTPPAPDTQRR